MLIRSNNNERAVRVNPGQYDNEFVRRYNYEESKNFKINYYPDQLKPDYFRWKYSDKQFYNPVKYSIPSRYERVLTLKDDTKLYHATNRYRGIKRSNNDQWYTVTNQTINRLDLIAQQYYGDSNYWWVIAHANNIFDALNDIYVGKILRIPPISSINGHYIN